MKIGLIDVDGHNFPNLALMKISAYHKAQGDEVEWWWGWGHYDRVYMSKVFDATYSPDIPEPLNATEVIKGGTGYDLDNKLPDEIEHCYPDYSLYPELTKDKAFGFLTRGCPNNCPFCIVCAKEGRKSCKVSDLDRWWHGQKQLGRKTSHGAFGTVYVLTNFNATMEENLHRIYTLRDMGFDPYVMIYDKPNAPREIRLLQRWCNNKIIFKSCPRFEDYDPRRG